MDSIILYSYFRSSCSYRVRIALNLKKLKYEYRAVHLIKDGGEQKSEAYKKLNPMGEVPTLIHKGLEINQSMAIVEYLDEVFPEISLFPSSAGERAKVRGLCEIVNSGIQPIQNLKVMLRVGELFGLDQQGKADWSHYWIRQGLESFENAIAKNSGKFCFGDSITAADCFLIPQVYNATRFKVNLAQFTNISKIVQNCQALAAFKNAAPEMQPDATN